MLAPPVTATLSVVAMLPSPVPRGLSEAHGSLMVVAGIIAVLASAITTTAT